VPSRVGIIYRERKAPVASTCDLTESPDPELVRELKTNGRVVTKPTFDKTRHVFLCDY
jgi:hypothetical protein